MQTRRTFLFQTGMVVALPAIPAWAGSPGSIGGALEVTQLANLAELSNQTIQVAEGVNQRVTMITNQIQQIQTALQSYQNMVANTLAIPQQLWSPIAGNLQQLHSAVSQGQALAYTIANVDDVIRQEFGQYSDFINNPLSSAQYAQQYRGWSQRNRETIAATMEATGLNIDQIATEETFMNTLRNRNTNTGRTQLLQVGNQVALEQVGQFQKLRQLVAANTQMMGAYFAKSEAVRDAQKAATDQYYGVGTTFSTTDGQRF
ncbi:P-type conjugative transfer protein TrbJ [uncultured Roseobacter sp.]|uniref:P-type conjugative transfer protein TrbJ n=1 Tax=uncultured Roseobacter sp. TaxID=114847 RepID=UPI0026044BDE|nr:P-type conjugative transfer protein TrbJ [uncultured Roseobacter sp.]